MVQIDVNEFKNKINKIDDILNFYYNESYMEWEGCHCHGGYRDNDCGVKAGEALNIIRDLRNMLEEI